MLTWSLLVALAGSQVSPVERVALKPEPGRLTVAFSVPGAATGEVGCSLFAGPDGFPLGYSRATVTGQPAGSSLTCRFDALTHGAYAVAISHDRNGNRKTDRNFVGIPKEAWGVSNNARPRLRAPRFDEARVTLSAGEHGSIAIEVRK